MTKLDVQFMENWLFWSLCAVTVLVIVLAVLRFKKNKKNVDE